MARAANPDMQAKMPAAGETVSPRPHPATGRNMPRARWEWIVELRALHAMTRNASYKRFLSRRR
ncbi:hypothetical protein C8T65DRAFT_650229 [Cerioporus squamosus]|nr:hypothetical protein C8T65DRAFT_650229 [Cerioporus squamosus]